MSASLLGSILSERLLRMIVKHLLTEIRTESLRQDESSFFCLDSDQLPDHGAILNRLGYRDHNVLV